MTTILLRIAGVWVCFIVAMLGLILAWYSFKLGIGFTSIFACLLISFLFTGGVVYLTRGA